MRKFYMVVRVAMKAVLVHKMRSFSTMLGVVIGVGAVIALVAVGEGTQAQVVSQFEALGSNLLTVSPGTSFGFSHGGLQTNSKPLVTADVEAIQALASAVAKVAPRSTLMPRSPMGPIPLTSASTGSLRSMPTCGRGP